jgi:uncharacterized protein YlxW (UPF0749 family)
VHEAGDERQEDEQRPQEIAQRQQPHRNPFSIQANKRTLAQNILKNQTFIKKYKNLDAQLQNTMFEYLSRHSGCNRW